MSSSRALGIAIATLALACSADEGASSVPRTNFAMLLPDVPRPRDALPYFDHHTAMIALCCPVTSLHHELPPESLPACRELQRVIDQEPVAFEHFRDWGPNCHREIPSDSLVVALKRRSPAAMRNLLEVLGELDPSEVVFRAVFDELVTLEMPPWADNFGKHAPYVIVLASGGEQELALLVPALRSKNPAIRRWAAHVFMHAAQAPLDLPDALAALDELAHDPDRLVARRAGDAARAYRRNSSKTPDQLIVDLLWAESVWRGSDSKRSVTHPNASVELTLLLGVKSRVIRLLGRRRAFCSSEAATALLEMFRADENLRFAYLAERALDLRARRCRS